MQSKTKTTAQAPIREDGTAASPEDVARPTQANCLVYVRVSTEQQSSERQMQGIRSFLGFEPNPRLVYEDKVSGRKIAGRERFQDMLAHARPGDHVVVYEASRLARSARDLLNIVERLTSDDVTVWIVDRNMCFSKTHSDPWSKAMLGLLATFAELEVDMARARQLEGIAIAKREKKFKGQQPKFHKVAEPAKALYTTGVSVSRIAEKLSCSRNTVYKALAWDGGFDGDGNPISNGTHSPEIKLAA